MRRIALLQIFRMHAIADPMLYVFFDRCVCHLIGTPEEMSAQPSVTDALYERAEAHLYDDRDFVWILKPQVSA